MGTTISNKTNCFACCTQNQEFTIDREEINFQSSNNAPQGQLFENAIKNLNSKEKVFFQICASRDIEKLRQICKEFEGRDLSEVCNLKDLNISTPLHIACRSGSYQIISEIIKLGAQINSADVEGWTPLHIASQQKRPDIVKLLLSSGADSTLLNSSQQTPWDLSGDNATFEVFTTFFKVNEPLDSYKMRSFDMEENGNFFSPQNSKNQTQTTKSKHNKSFSFSPQNKTAKIVIPKLQLDKVFKRSNTNTKKESKMKGLQQPQNTINANAQQQKAAVVNMSYQSTPHEFHNLLKANIKTETNELDEIVLTPAINTSKSGSFNFMKSNVSILK